MWSMSQGDLTMIVGDPLLQPFQLKHLNLRNRIFSSSHEPAYAENGMPTRRYRLYHEEKAKGGVALTMTAGSAVVSADSPPAFGNLHAFDDAIVPWIREMVDGIHSHGAAAMIQLTHLGRRAGGWGQDDWLPVLGPSPIREPAHRNIPKVAEEWDLERIIGDYADAAERMKAGGMDGIEIEAQGHLLDQFWSPFTNHRDDEYGGSLENRMRFPLAVFRALRHRVGDDLVISLRMGMDEQTPAGLDRASAMQIVAMLHGEGLIDVLNINRGRIETDAALVNVIPIHGMPAAPHLAFAGGVRAEVGSSSAAARAPLAVFHAAKIDDVATARHAIREGLVDMIGMTRAHLADPHIVRKITLGREAEIRPCVGATYCLDRIYEAGEALCIHNAATSREETMPHEITRAATPRRVVVVGAGPAGLEAGRVAGERGHHVTVLEAMPHPGGQLVLAARNPRRRDLNGIIEWRVAELARLGVKLHLDTYADHRFVEELQPDVVIIATGGQPQLPPLESGEELVVTTWDVIAGDAKPTGDVLLFDDNGSHSALSAAEVLTRRDNVRLELVTPERALGIAVGGMNFVPYAKALNETGARMTLNQRVVAVERMPDRRLSVTIGSDQTDHREQRIVDHVVVDFGTSALDDVYQEMCPHSTNEGAVDYAALRDGMPQTLVRNPDGRYQLFRIGDAVASRNVHAAIYDALRLCKDL
jgi:N-methyl-L-proline demethylase